jgi:hypothetical protein
VVSISRIASPSPREGAIILWLLIKGKGKPRRYAALVSAGKRANDVRFATPAGRPRGVHHVANVSRSWSTGAFALRTILTRIMAIQTRFKREILPTSRGQFGGDACSLDFIISSNSDRDTTPFNLSAFIEWAFGRIGATGIAGDYGRFPRAGHEPTASVLAGTIW